MTETGEIRALQDAFVERNALQCGFCTPGMLLTIAELMERKPDASRDEIRKYISGNYCRCTGYQAIVDAVEMTRGTMGRMGASAGKTGASVGRKGASA